MDIACSNKLQKYKMQKIKLRKLMNHTQYKTKTNANDIAIRLLSNVFSINSVTSGLAVLCLTFAGASIAEWHEDTETTAVYVDSIHQWGPWELDIEPAAGGIQPPSTKALNARDSKVTLRTNSIAALAPTAPTPVVFQTPTTPVVPPVVPVTPPAPPVTPPRPAAPINFAPPGAAPATVVTLPGKFN
jgi:hypothetical protein